MVMTSLREGASGGITKIILFGFLVLATGGLVLTDVGGFFRGGVSSSDVAKAGEAKLSLQSFDRTVRRSLGNLGITPQEAYQLGYIDEMLAAEIRNLLMRQEAQKLGIVVGDERIARQISRMVEPLLQEGQSKQEILDQILMSQGMSERDFVNAIASELSSSLLLNAVRAGFSDISPVMAKDIYKYDNEKRNLEVIFVPHKDVKNIAEPTDEQLLQRYQVRQSAYKVPQRRDLVIGTIDTSTLEKTLEITEEEMRALYEQEIDAFQLPEQRSVAQAILKSEENALAVLEKAKEGTALQKAVRSVTGGTGPFRDTIDFQKEGLPEALREPVFSANKDEIVGPLQTPLGYHVMKIVDIKAPRTRPYDEVKNQIKAELNQIKIADQQFELANSVDDLLAGGATLAEVNEQVPIKEDLVLNITSFGSDHDGKDLLSDYAEDRDAILELAFSLFEAEFSPVMELSDGRMVVIEIDKINEESFIPFEDVKDEIAQGWKNDQRASANRTQLLANLTNIENGERSFNDIAASHGKKVQKLKNVKRGEEPAEPLDSLALSNIFNADPESIIMSDTSDGAALIKVTQVSLPEKIAPEDIELTQETLARTARNEAISTYVQHLQNKYGVTINQRLLDLAYRLEDQ